MQGAPYLCCFSQLTKGNICMYIRLCDLSVTHSMELLLLQIQHYLMRIDDWNQRRVLEWRAKDRSL